MKLELFKNFITKEQKEVPLRKSFFVILFLSIVSILYILVVRPFLKPTMATVPVELGIVGIVILSICISILINVITLLITLIMFLRKRKKEIIDMWRLRIKRQWFFTLKLILIFAFITLISQYITYTPPILGEDGKVISGSIAELEKVTLNGSKQWISMRGKNENNPILLFLSGGPGGTQMGATRDNLKDLEENFVVVNWDQPGSGKSYNSVYSKDLTPKRYVSDAYELTKYLCKRFNQDKIYVLGESWGSALGIMLVGKYPELYHAFIGTGQMVNFLATENYCFDLALQLAKENGDTETVEKLQAQKRPPYYGNDVTWKSASYLMYLSDYMTKNPSISNPGYNTIRDISSPEYGLYDKVNYMRGIVNTFNFVYPQLYKMDLRKQYAKIDVPVYFLEGRYDINAPIELAEDYYNKLNAPIKKLIWFEYSGHSPWINESQEFVDTMVNVVLKETS